MGYRVQNIKILSPKELTSTLCKSAKIYAEYVDTTLLFIFRGNRAEDYNYYEVQFGKNNFMHLAGIKSKRLSAVQFFDACMDGQIMKEDCNPRRDMTTTYAKVAIMEQILDLRNSKCYKIGEKDLVTRENDFEMATGNEKGIIGYDSRVTMKGRRDIDRLKAPVPTTLLNNPITQYCSKPQKIMYILQKADDEVTYKRLFYEIKKGLFEIEKSKFPLQLHRRLWHPDIQQEN